MAAYDRATTEAGRLCELRNAPGGPDYAVNTGILIWFSLGSDEIATVWVECV